MTGVCSLKRGDQRGETLCQQGFILRSGSARERCGALKGGGCFVVTALFSEGYINSSCLFFRSRLHCWLIFPTA